MMKTSADIRNTLVYDFREALDRFVSLVAREKVPVVAYDGDHPARFASLPEDKQKETLENFRRYLSVAEETVSAGESLGQDGQILWRMFQRLKVRPVADLMSRLAAGDIIEIYTPAYVQVFRNIHFFSVCSYTLDDLLCRPFWELFRRDESLTGRLLKVTDAVLAGQVPGIHWWNVGTHTVDEIDSPKMYHANVEYKLASPLYDSRGQVAAFVNVFAVLSCEAGGRSSE